MASGVNDHGESPSLSPVRQNIQPSVPAAIERGSKWSKRRDPDSINKDRPQKDTKSKRKRNIASPSIPKGKRQRGSQPSPEPMDSSTHSRTLRSTTRAASLAASLSDKPQALSTTTRERCQTDACKRNRAICAWEQCKMQGTFKC